MANKIGPGYWGFMENSAGLGKNGTHLAHGAMAGGATWAVGRYGNVEAISSRWWAPFVGAFSGLGLSVAVRYLMVDDDVRVAILEDKIRRDLKSVKLDASQRDRLQAVLDEMKVIEAKETKKETKKATARKAAAS